MFLATSKYDELLTYSSKDLKSLYADMERDAVNLEEFDFYEGTKIEVREIPSRLEIVLEVKKPVPVRKPAAKVKK